MVLWTSTDADTATGGHSTHAWAASGVSIDTRTLQTGDLFVALKDIRDGHDFVAMAASKGASAALVTHRPDGVGDDFPLIIVDDVLDALCALGRAARARTDARILAITGSVGKTSAKEMLRTVLERQGRTHASVASYNNHWGVPLTLARMPADTEFGVFEVGMNAPGEIAPLSQMIRPHVAMITTIAPAHIEAFGVIDGIAREKSEIVAGLMPGGAAVLPADAQCCDILVDRARQAQATIVGFGERADAYALTAVQIVDDTTIVQARFRGAPAVFKLSAPGRHFASNGLGVIAAVEALGANPTLAALDLQRWQPPAGRGRRFSVALDAQSDAAHIQVIDDAYNANPTSMTAALEVLAGANPTKPGRRVAVLGDMLELGDETPQMHAQLAQDPSVAMIDTIHCVGPHMMHLYHALSRDKRGEWAQTSAEMADMLAKLTKPGDVVLVKGSLGAKMAHTVDALRNLGHR